MRVFGIDPGSERTGYGCLETDGQRHHLVACGAIIVPARAAFPDRLRLIHEGLSAVLREHQPELVAIESVFHAANVRSALKLGHARGVAMLAAVEAGLTVAEYTPAEIKRAVVGWQDVMTAGVSGARVVAQLVAPVSGVGVGDVMFGPDGELLIAGAGNRDALGCTVIASLPPVTSATSRANALRFSL